MYNKNEIMEENTIKVTGWNDLQERLDAMDTFNADEGRWIEDNKKLLSFFIADTEDDMTRFYNVHIPNSEIIIAIGKNRNADNVFEIGG